MCNERKQDENCKGKCNQQSSKSNLVSIEETKGLQRKLDRQEFLNMVLNDPDIRPFYDHASVVRMEEELATLDLELPKPPPVSEDDFIEVEDF